MKLRLNLPFQFFFASLVFFPFFFGACSEEMADKDNPPAGKSTAFALVKEGRPLAPLVLAPDATPRNREAARELATAIRNISGAEVEILEATPATAPARAVWIGRQPGMEKLFPGVDLELTQPEEIRLVTTTDHLLIAGRDRFDPKHFTIPGQFEPIEGKQWEYGTANAVYTFIQDALGVRWVLPGPLGVDYVESPSITVQPLDVRYHPQFRLRMGILNMYDQGTVRGGAIRDWARHQRMLLDSLDIDGGHAFTEWWERYGETRPELFALQPDGTRGTIPAEGHHKKICEGEPAVWDVWLEEVGQTLEENPMKMIFNVSANDNWSTGHCVDPRSQAWDPPRDQAGELVTYNYADGVRLQRPPMSDRYVTFANKLAEKLKAKYPDRELFVSQAAYGGTSRQAPVSARPHDNVIILSVHNFLFRGKAEREEQMRMFDDWSKLAKTFIWRPNMGGSSGWSWGTPDVGFTRAAHDLKWVAERGTIGIFIDMIWDHWGTQGPLYYLLAQLAWNPYQDANVILEDFCQRSYGPAGATMLTYWRLMETMRDRIEDESPTRFRMVDSPRYYTAEFFAQAQALLDQADKETAEAPEKYGKRLELVQAGLDYTKFVIDTRAAMQRWEDSKGRDEEAKAHVLANWAKADEMRKNSPEFAISWIRSFRNDVPATKQRRRMFGLHPDLALKGKFLEEYRSGGTAAKDELE